MYGYDYCNIIQKHKVEVGQAVTYVGTVCTICPKRGNQTEQEQ